MEKKNLFAEAQDMVSRLTNQNGNANDTEKHAAEHAISAAYANATEEEKGQLEQLEQILKDQDLLS